MAEHQAFYRKWRPQRFSEVVGQTYALKTLVNALGSSEVGHAYLFAGPRGTGKTTVARLFAKAVNCENSQGGEPCNECAACLRIARGASLDVVEIDGASNRGIDQIRKLREEVNFVAADVRNKVYIIDEVHMLTNEAFNALLKTLEEPPKRVIFIFATTEVNKLPPTVLSRCQAFEFTRISPADMLAHLRKICDAEGIQAEDRALEIITSRSGGALRDALVTLEQVAAYAQGQPIQGETLETVLGLPSESMLQDFLGATLNGDGPGALAILEDLSQRGRDLELFLEELIRMSRDWLVAVVAKQPLPIDAPPPKVASLTKHLLTLKRDMNRAWDKKIWFEVGLLEWLQSGTPTAIAQPSTPPASQPQPQTQPAQTPEPQQTQPTVQETTPTPSASEQAPGQVSEQDVVESESDSPAEQPATTPEPAQPEPPMQEQAQSEEPIPVQPEQAQADDEPAPVLEDELEQLQPEAASTPEPQQERPQPVQEETSLADAAPLGLDQAWHKLLDTVREERVAVYAYLVEGLPKFQDDTLSVLYDPHHSFHKESIEKDEIKSYVFDKAKSLFGSDVSLNIGFQERSTVATSPPPESSDSGTTEPDTTQHAPPPPRPHSTSSLDEKAALVQKVLGSETPE